MLRNYKASGNGWENMKESSWREHKETVVFSGLRLTTEQQTNPSKYKFVTDDKYTFVSYLRLSLGNGYIWMSMEEEDLQKYCCQVMEKMMGLRYQVTLPLPVERIVNTYQRMVAGPRGTRPIFYYSLLQMVVKKLNI